MKQYKRNIPMIAITSLPLTAVSEGFQYVYQDWEFAKWIAIAVSIDTFLGVDPYVSGSSEMCELLTEGTRKWTGAAYTVETDIEKLTDLMIERIEEKRTALGI